MPATLFYQFETPFEVKEFRFRFTIMADEKIIRSIFPEVLVICLVSAAKAVAQALSKLVIFHRNESTHIEHPHSP